MALDRQAHELEGFGPDELLDDEAAGNLPAALPAPVDLRTLQAVAVLRGAVSSMHDQVEKLKAAGDYETLGMGLGDLEALISDLIILRDSARAALAAGKEGGKPLLPHKYTPLPDGRTAELKRKAGRTEWEPELLVPLLVRRAVMVEGTGEIPTEVEPYLEPIAQAFLKCAGLTRSHSWGIRGLALYGITADNYKQTEVGALTVEVHDA